MLDQDVLVPSSEELRGTGKDMPGGRVVSPLSTWAREAVADRNLRSRWNDVVGLSETITELGSRVASGAFVDEDVNALHDLHATLFALYELHVARPGSAEARNQFDPNLIALRNVLERSWFDAEYVQFAIDSRQRDTSIVVDSIREMWATSDAGTHSFFDFLETEATLPQLLAFFRSDAALNTRFFDLIAFALIGSSNSARRELVQNMWDEAGRGDPQKGHVFLFESLLRTTGVTDLPDARHLELGLHGLIGHNLFMATCTNREHYFKSLGVMAITELMDPAHYEKLVRGCRRLGLGHAGELEYYEEHVTIDVVHGEGWLQNVIAPAVIEDPAAADEILFGAYMRLKTCAAYYDELQVRLTRYR
ncbi:iron-containing redox enzyme family protein [Burkholderia ubonensis]|uniref:iron-containing redox enzyme family protein n=1 Tax=Burkholderia ubonensis TaxID=101571 RepID=UPI00358FE703